MIATKGRFDRKFQLATLKHNLESQSEFFRLSLQKKLKEKDAVFLLGKALMEMGGKGLTAREAAGICNLGWSRSRRLLGLYFRARRHLNHTFYRLRHVVNEASP